MEGKDVRDGFFSVFLSLFLLTVRPFFVCAFYFLVTKWRNRWLGGLIRLILFVAMKGICCGVGGGGGGLLVNVG